MKRENMFEFIIDTNRRCLCHTDVILIRRTADSFSGNSIEPTGGVAELCL